MPCIAKTIDSNITGLAIAEEDCPGLLPDPETDTIWYEQEPNNYSGFSSTIESVQRNTINPSRQNQKGAVTDEQVAGGFTSDLTKSNITRFMQGFFFADARQPASVKTNLTGVKQSFTSVDMASGGGLTDTFNHSAGMMTGVGFVAGQLVKKYGWADPLDNGLAVIASIASLTTALTSDLARTAHTVSSPPAEAGFEVVGIQFASADVNVSLVSDILTLTSTVYDFTTNTNLFAGQWIFLGGDLTAAQFTNNVPGYARIRSIAANALVLEEPTWVPVTETGTGKLIRLFFGLTIKNEKLPALIKKRTYQLERTLGNSSEGLPQAEYLKGCVSNECAINIPAKDKATVDLNYVGATGEERTGLTPDLIKLGTRVAAKNESMLNTSNNVFLARMSLLNETSLATTDLFAYITEGSFTISNAATPQPAVGILGALDITTGNITVGGSVTAYFTTVKTKTAIRQNQTVSLSFIFGKDNAGVVVDVPELTLSGGDLSVEKDSPITIPLTTMAHENKFGYSASYTEFRYLPEVGMPAGG